MINTPITSTEESVSSQIYEADLRFIYTEGARKYEQSSLIRFKANGTKDAVQAILRYVKIRQGIELGGFGPLGSIRLSRFCPDFVGGRGEYTSPVESVAFLWQAENTRRGGGCGPNHLELSQMITDSGIIIDGSLVL